jgi:hypothetical protein
MQLTVGIPSAHALGWAMVAVDCSLARAPRFLNIFVTFDFVRFDGESQTSHCYYPLWERCLQPFGVTVRNLGRVLLRMSCTT